MAAVLEYVLDENTKCYDIKSFLTSDVNKRESITCGTCTVDKTTFATQFIHQIHMIVDRSSFYQKPEDDITMQTHINPTRTSKSPKFSDIRSETKSTSPRHEIKQSNPIRFTPNKDPRSRCRSNEVDYRLRTQNFTLGDFIVAKNKRRSLGSQQRYNVNTDTSASPPVINTITQRRIKPTPYDETNKLNFGSVQQFQHSDTFSVAEIDSKNFETERELLRNEKLCYNQPFANVSNNIPKPRESDIFNLVLNGYLKQSANPCQSSKNEIRNSASETNIASFNKAPMNTCKNPKHEMENSCCDPDIIGFNKLTVNNCIIPKSERKNSLPIGEADITVFSETHTNVSTTPEMKTKNSPSETDITKVNSDVGVTDMIRVRNVNAIPMIEPNAALITNKQKLENLCDIYCCCFRQNLIRNIFIELSFIMELLVLQANKDNSDSKNVFISIHNCVYFACEVLWNIRDFVKQLDIPTKKLLIKNSRVENYKPALKTYLEQTCDEVTTVGSVIVIPKSPIATILFQIETDNRENFPYDISFHGFCKQRDAFYEVLRQWEVNHLTPNWSFEITLGKRINLLLDHCTEPTNYIHLARLFQSQLINMCLGNSPAEISKLLWDLGVDLDKLKKLQERFVTPKSTTLKKPAFPGQQEFFHDFIVIAKSNLFNQHLKESLIAELLELDSTEFVESSDVENSRSLNDSDMKTEYVSKVLTSQLLGKFLGLVTFLHYQAKKKLPKNIVQAQLKIREKFQPSFDVLKLLQDAYNYNKLILTLPWIVEYLIMLDPVTTMTPYYENVFQFLMTIYSTLTLRSELSESNSFFIRLVFARLFEMEGVEFGNNHVIMKSQLSNQFQLDLLEVVNCSLIYTVFPQLHDLRKILEYFKGCSKVLSSSKHITPHTSERTSGNVKGEKRSIQVLLEENFFHNQPSLKKTVEFVTERIASNIVKQIRHKILPNFQQQALDEALKLINEESCVPQNRKSVFTAIQEIASTKYAECTKTCSHLIETYRNEKCHAAIIILIPEDTPKGALNMACMIAFRQTKQKSMNWLQLHVTESLFSNELITEAGKKWMRVLCNNDADLEETHTKIVNNAEQIFDDATVPASTTLRGIKDVLFMFLTGEGSTTESTISTLLQNVMLDVTRRDDIVPVIVEECFSVLTIDLAMTLLTYQPSIMKSPIQDQLVSLWKNQLRDHVDFSCLISPRNMMLFGQSNQLRDTFDRLQHLITRLFQAELMNCEQFQDQCMVLLRQEWPQNVLQRFAICVQGVVSTITSKPCKDEREANLVQLLEWIAWFCAEVEDLD